jgi:D-alanyl-D-alanine carboxypeptidase
VSNRLLSAAFPGGMRHRFGRSLAVLFASLAILLSSFGSAWAARSAAIIMDAATGAVLYEDDADAPRYPASLTKVMTLYLLFEAIDSKRITLETRFPVSARAANQDPTKLGLRDGETIAVREIILGLVTKSANDAAVVAAEGLAGSEPQFALQMTEKARRLGMASTTFRNASGLPDPQQKTTARDLAMLARAMLKSFPHHYHFFDTASFSYKGITHANHNRLNNWYQGADGMKTGYIRASGFNLVTSAKRDNRRLIGVVMGGISPGSRDQEMARLLDAAFARNDNETIIRHARAPRAKPEAKQVQLARQTPKPAKVAQVAKPARAEASVARDAGVWGVQVGAFSQTDAARRAAEQATKLAPTHLGDATVQLAPHTTKKGQMYRARLVGISESDARKACRALKRKMECVTLPPAELSRGASTASAAS